jgi:hypothetical protein
LLDSRFHCQVGGFDYVVLIYIAVGDDADSDRDALFLNMPVYILPFSRDEQLGIPHQSQPAGLEARRQDDGGGNDRAGQGAAPGLVDAGDMAVARRLQRLFLFERRPELFWYGV